MLGKVGSVKFVLFCCLMSKLAPEPGDKELNAAGCQRLKKQSNSGNARALGVS